jgi:hypothetical protein
VRVHRTARPATTHELEISDDLYERIESHPGGEPHQEFVAELLNIYETKLPASGGRRRVSGPATRSPPRLSRQTGRRPHRPVRFCSIT